MEAARKLKVLLSAYSVDAEDVSEAQLAYEWIRHLAAHVELSVLSIGSRHQRPSGLEELANVRYIEIRPSVSWNRFDVLDRAIHPGVIEFNFKVARLLRTELSRERFDVCHALAPFAPRYSSPLRRLNIPFLVGPLMGGVDIPQEFPEAQQGEPFYFRLRKLDRARLRWAPALRSTYRRADRILLMGEYLRGLLPRPLWPKAEILSSIGINASAFSPLAVEKAERKRLELLYVGRIVAFKGLLYVLRAIGRLSRELPVHLTVVGDGPLRAPYEAQARQLGIESRVSWLGSIPHAEVSEYFSRCDVFCFPSLNEAGGIVVLEALASGKPVICVDRGGPGAVVDFSCGIALEARSPEQLVEGTAKAIERLAGDKEYRERLSHGARARAERFDWQCLARKMVSVYEELCPSREDEPGAGTLTSRESGR